MIKLKKYNMEWVKSKALWSKIMFILIKKMRDVLKHLALPKLQERPYEKTLIYN